MVHLLRRGEQVPVGQTAGRNLVPSDVACMSNIWEESTKYKGSCCRCFSSPRNRLAPCDRAFASVTSGEEHRLIGFCTCRRFARSSCVGGWRGTCRALAGRGSGHAPVMTSCDAAGCAAQWLSSRDGEYRQSSNLCICSAFSPCSGFGIVAGGASAKLKCACTLTWQQRCHFAG